MTQEQTTAIEVRDRVPVAVDPAMALVDVEAARAAWENYQELKSAVLDDDDYLWIVAYKETWTGRDNKSRTNTRRQSFDSVEDARSFAGRQQPPGVVKGKIKKSGCHKLARFFNLEIPELGMGQVEVKQIGEFVLQVERGDYYTVTQWLDPKNLNTIKASATVVVRAPDGRSRPGSSGAHRDEKFDDFAVASVAWTRAVNRAVIELVGMGDQTDDDPTEGAPETPPTDSAVAGAANQPGPVEPSRSQGLEGLDPDTGEIVEAGEDSEVANLERALNRDLSALQTPSDLFRACWEDFKVQPPQVVEACGYSTAKDLEGLELGSLYWQVNAVYREGGC